MSNTKVTTYNALESYSEKQVDKSERYVESLVDENKTSIMATKSNALSTLNGYLGSVSMKWVQTEANYNTIYAAGSTGAYVTIDGVVEHVIYSDSVVYWYFEE